MTQYTPEQIAANRAKWLEALRSGKYQQGRDVLRAGDSFCCLGVACDLYDSSRWEEGTNCYTQLSFYPPEEVRLAFGLPSSYGLGSYGDRGDGKGVTLTNWIAHMNDQGNTFSKIADFLEQEFSK